MVAGIEKRTQIDGRLGSGRQLNGSIANVEEGEAISLLCAVNGSTAMQFQWFRNGHHISDVDTQKLMLNELSVADSGTYTCAARNQAGSTRLNVPFVVNVVGSAQTTNRLISFTEHSIAVDSLSARLVCSVRGANDRSQPVAWSFRGTLLTNSSQ